MSSDNLAVEALPPLEDPAPDVRPDPSLVVVTPDGTAFEAAIDGSMFYVSLATIHGRMAARAYAYSLAAFDPATARAVLGIVGREG